MTRRRTLRPSSDKPDPTETQSIRFSLEEKALIQKAAERYTEGNFSEYVRYSALNFVPEAEDFDDGKH